MRPGRRAPDGEDLPVVRLDDDGTRGLTTTDSVDLGRPRHRARELVLVVVAIAVVVAVGLVGGTGDAGDDTDATTDTTRGRARRESDEEHRRTSTTGARRSTTSSTTTTTLLEHLAGSGPLLPGDPTGTTIGFADSAGVATIVDLDTGDRCRVQVARGDTWSPWPTRSHETFWVQADERVYEIDRACAVTQRTVGYHEGWPAAITGDTVWVVDHDGATVSEHLLRTNEATGRSFAVPQYAQVGIVGVDGGVVVSANGDMTLLDLRTGDLHALGTGTVLVGRDRSVVYTACPGLQCHVGVLDVDSGERRTLAAVSALPWEGPSISPDGHFVRIAATRGEHQVPMSLVLDVVRGGVVLETDLEQPVFTDDSRWLVGIERGNLAIVRLDGTYPQIPIDVSGHTVRTLAVLRSS